MAEVYFNNAWTYLTGDIADTDLSMTVDNSAPFTPLAGGDWFRCSLWNEVIKVTAIAGTVWTIERELEGTALATTPAGTAVIHQPTAGMLTDLPPGPAGPPGADGTPGTPGNPNGSVGVVFDGINGSAEPSVSQIIRVPFDCTLEWFFIEGTPGSESCSVDVYIGTTPTLSSANSVCGGNIPSLATAANRYDNTLTSWSVNVLEGDYVQFELLTNTAFVKIALQVGYERV